MLNDHYKSLISLFVLPVARSIALVLGGFLLAPTEVLYSLYQEYDAIKWIAVLLGAFVSIFGLFSMLKISIKTIEALKS